MRFSLNARSMWVGVAHMMGVAARSPWMSVAAALAVVLGTTGTYLSGDIAADIQGCEIKREILAEDGPPELRAYRGAVAKMTSAQAYMALAMSTREQEQRREYAYLGIASANGAITETTLEKDAKLELLPYPDEKQLASPEYMSWLSRHVFKLDVTQLIYTLRANDERMTTELGDLAECNRVGDIGNALGFAGVLFTLLSVILIAIREYHQRKNNRQSRRSKSTQTT